MNLLAGLEKFGFKSAEVTNLYEEEKRAQSDSDGADKKEEAPDEESFLLDKTVSCPVCDKMFKTKAVKSGRIRRLQPDLDLRPRFEYIDTIKYNIYFCPHCGYAALQRSFEHLSSLQIRLIKGQVCANYKPEDISMPEGAVDYDTAIERYKLALLSAVAKRAKSSEKAYLCLNLSWALRSRLEEMSPDDPETQALYNEYQEQAESYYEQAFEGFTKAIATENYPICGMDECTLDYLLSALAYHFKKYDIASKCISRILQSRSATKKMKDRAFELKQMIVSELRQGKQ